MLPRVGRILAAVALATALAGGGCSILVPLDVLESGGDGGAGPGPSTTGGGDGPITSGPTSSTQTSGPGSSTGAGAGGGGGGATTGPGGGAGGGEPVPCGGPSVLADDFSDEVRTLRRWSGGSDEPYVTIAGGTLSLSPPGDGGESWIAFQSRHRVDLRDEALAATVLEVLPSQSSTSSLLLAIARNSDDHVGIRVDEGTIQLITYVGAAFSAIGSETYDPESMRVWRLRHEGTDVIGETSPDGASWTELGRVSEEALFDLSVVRPAIVAQCSFVGACGTFELDDVGGLFDGARHCEPADFTDDFADGVASPEWTVDAGAGCGPVEDGELSFPLAPDTVEYCSYRTVREFDLRGDGVVVRVTSRTNPGQSSEGYLEVVDADDEGAILVAKGTSIAAQKQDPSSLVLHNAPYDPDLEPWWRIRDDGGTIRYEVSSDAASWRQLAEERTWFDSSAVEIGLVGGVYEASDDPGTPAFDDYNLPP